MRITNLKAENIKRLTMVEVSPDRNFVVISGKNAAGKSSLLDSVIYLLGGNSALDDVPIRMGEDHATACIETEMYIIERTFTERGSYLRVLSKEGAEYPKPQQLLNRFTGKVGFDPLALKEMSPKKQRDTFLRFITDQDKLDALEKEREETYKERTEVNRTVTALKAQLDQINVDPYVPDEFIDIQTLKDDISDAEGHLFNRESGIEKVVSLTGKIEKAQNDIENWKTEIKNIEVFLDQPAPKLVDLKIKLSEAQVKNIAIMDKKRYGILVENLEYAQDNSQSMTKKLAEIDTKKVEILSTANFPVDGLSIDSNQVLYHDLPLQQCAASEQLRIWTAVAMSFNPELRVLLIRDAALLDDENLELLSEMAVENDFQIWIEVVGEKEGSVVIRDGKVVQNSGLVTDEDPDAEEKMPWD